MKKIFSVLRSIIMAVILFALLFSSAPVAKAQGVDDAVSYLKSKDSSVWIAIALFGAGEGSDASFLKNSTGSSAIQLAAPIMAIASAGENPRVYPKENLVQKLKSFFDGIQIGDASALNDDIFGILALSSAGEAQSSAEITGAEQFIVSHQNEDGGWGWGVGTASDTNTTAAAIMALAEAGMPVSDDTIKTAKEYLKNSQNEDGGFPYDPKSEWGKASDASSDAWVVSAILKLGEDPRSWIKNANNPIDHLLSLQKTEGYFENQQGSGETSFTPTETAYAVIALSGKSLPVKKFVLQEESSPNTAVEVAFRIEGSESQVCRGKILATTVLDVVKNAAEQCGYSYNIDQTSFGPYLSKIGSDAAEGANGWMYYVNWISPSVGAADYELSFDDEVLWYYGDWQWKPLRLSLSNSENSYSVSDILAGKAETYEGGAWKGITEAEILLGGTTAKTENDGTFKISLGKEGIFEARAQKEGFIRSNVVEVAVGALSSEVSLSVEVVEDEGEKETDPQIGFIVSPSALAFGKIAAGDSGIQEITLHNTGKTDLSVKAALQGDSVFNFLKLGEVLGSSFQKILGAGKQEKINASLSIPNEFKLFGQKQGTLIFWAIPK
ncbi:MAG: DUF4430 domain-containing protein [Candidatus Wildermuthbacteria bacterium]|nr:DUF4430 domain-containing protein [Candidatus Wildermuthbacteria bacterium]